jgi:UDPglucose--hexose-1-phosphate uridylyltransferase
VRPRVVIESAPRIAAASYDATCPFCPGNEHLAETEVYRRPTAASAPWRTRSVVNRYAVLSPQSSCDAMHAGLHHSVAGFGIHEVIIDTPRHDRAPALGECAELEAVIATYRERYLAARVDPRIQHVVIFKNHGPIAGTSLPHPHSQLVATPVVSWQVRDRIRTMEDHFALYGECVLCRLIAEEIADGGRIVELSPEFVALVPYAALSPFHVWLFPRRHMASFSELREEEIPPFADCLRRVLLRLHHALGDPDHNYVIRSAPRNCVCEEYHWYVSIVPRLGRAAGFELGSGIYVNDTYPENAAALLRSIELP